MRLRMCLFYLSLMCFFRFDWSSYCLEASLRLVLMIWQKLARRKGFVARGELHYVACMYCSLSVMNTYSSAPTSWFVHARGRDC